MSEQRESGVGTDDDQVIKAWGTSRMEETTPPKVSRQPCLIVLGHSHLICLPFVPVDRTPPASAPAALTTAAAASVSDRESDVPLRRLQASAERNKSEQIKKMTRVFEAAGGGRLGEAAERGLRSASFKCNITKPGQNPGRTATAQEVTMKTKAPLRFGRQAPFLWGQGYSMRLEFALIGVWSPGRRWC